MFPKNLKNILPATPIDRALVALFAEKLAIFTPNAKNPLIAIVYNKISKAPT